jgi:6-pyruvoyltetrahydropterin/6-carboxytetrahydropterin synthase
METVMYEVGVVARFEAAHRLTGDFGPATRLHGHTYRVEATVRGETLTDDGVLCDIGRLKPALEAEVGRLHYQNLDEVEGLAGRNTTAERVAKFLHEGLATALHMSGGFTMAVRVWESPDVFASYEGPLSSAPAHGP